MTEKRTYQQRREYMLKAVKKRRAKVREMAVEYKGGSCEVCGYNRCIEALEFHHLDPTKKILEFPQKVIPEAGKR